MLPKVFTATKLEVHVALPFLPALAAGGPGALQAAGAEEQR